MKFPPRRRLRPRNGLSLTELMVVIAIILVLMALLLTVASGAYKAARALKGG